MGYPKLYAAFFWALFGNYQHWALYLDSDEEQLLFEVTGEHPKFERNIQECPPDLLDGFLHNLYIGVIGKNDIDMVKQISETVIVDNKTFEWDCQEYVLDILDRLEEERISRCEGDFEGEERSDVVDGWCDMI